MRNIQTAFFYLLSTAFCLLALTFLRTGCLQTLSYLFALDNSQPEKPAPTPQPIEADFWIPNGLRSSLEL